MVASCFRANSPLHIGHIEVVDEVYEKLQYDFFHIRYFSPWLDVLILFRTMRTILTGFGAR